MIQRRVSTRRRAEPMNVDYSMRVTMPIRDMQQDGRIAFLVDVYGVTPSDLTTIGGPIGSKPLLKAVMRMGLDPDRYQTVIWDVAGSL